MKPHKIPEKKIKKLHEYIEYISREHSSRDALFRGQLWDKDLVPKIARISFINNKISELEQVMYNDFKRQAPLFIDSLPDTHWEWLALAQHHGMATRYLDWTTNPLVALWFAIERPHPMDGEKENYGVVWIMRHSEEQEVRTPGVENPFEISSTKIYHPKHVTRRIRAQSGCFTVHKFVESKVGEYEEAMALGVGGEVKKGYFVAINDDSDYIDKLIKIKIPAESFPSIRQELGRCSFNAATMYSDIDGLARHIEWQSSLLKDEQKALDNEVAKRVSSGQVGIHILR